MTIDDSKKEFKKFLQEYEALKILDMSESDTRSKIIDKLLITVLGWREQDIEREGHLDSGYYDYKVSLPGFHLVIEAKKQFVEFTLPTKRRRTSLNTLFPENKDVILQIRNYLTDSGIPNGVITNGKQFLIGKFVNNDATSWRNNQCLIFNGFQDIENRFIEFHNNLSRESIVETGNFPFLAEDLNTQSYKIVSTLVDREKEIVRNNLSAEITPLIDYVFGEIFRETTDDNKEFIKECFIENKEIKKNRNEIERLFGDNAPNLAEVIPVANTDGLVSQIEQEINELPVIARDLSPPKPIVIVGSKGAGKTTFINYLFKHKLGESTLANHPYVYVDFRKYFNQDKNFDSNKIAVDILTSLYENYSELQLHSLNVLKRIYIKEIKWRDEGVWKNLRENNKHEYEKKLNKYLSKNSEKSLEHLEALSRYLIRERRIRLLLVFDNADQFDSKIQEKIFLFANSISRTALCGVLVSLREGYYYKWRNSPPFDAFESNVYHITAPRYEEVLQKRIKYTLNKLELNGITTGVSKKGFMVKMDNQNVYEFLFGLNNSLFNEANSSIIDFLNYSTFPNIREGLRLFKLFLVSGYTDVSEYIMRVRYNTKEKQVSIPIHEFFKSIGLHNKLYYNHEISAIPNIFYPTQGSDDHFLKIWVLKFLQRKLDDGGNASKFIQYSILLEYFTNVGYKYVIVNQEVQELLKNEFVLSDDLVSDIEWDNLTSVDKNVCLSAKGSYYLKEAKNRFYYLDLVLQDVPIFSKDHFESIRNVFPLSNDEGIRVLSERVNTVKEFINYLKYKEKEQPRELVNVFGSIVDEILSHGLNKDIDRITKKYPKSDP